MIRMLEFTVGVDDVNGKITLICENKEFRTNEGKNYKNITTHTKMDKVVKEFDDEFSSWYSNIMED